MVKQLSEPLSIEQVFIHSFSLFKETWRSVLPITIFLGIVILSPSLWFYNPDQPLFFLAYFIFSTYIFSCLIYYMGSNLRGEPIPLRQALVFSGKKFIYIILASILMTLCTLLGYALFIIPGVIVTVWVSMCMPLILFDRANPLNVIRKSYELTTDEWWRTALVVFLPIALLSLIGLPLQEAVWNKLINLQIYRVIRDILFIVICLSYFPWVASLVVVQFEDLKRRQAIRQLRGTPMQFENPENR